MRQAVRSMICAASCVLAMSACSHGGPVLRPEVRPVTLQPLPADMMATPAFGLKARSRLFRMPTEPTVGSNGFRPNWPAPDKP